MDANCWLVLPIPSLAINIISSDDHLDILFPRPSPSSPASDTLPQTPAELCGKEEFLCAKIEYFSNFPSSPSFKNQEHNTIDGRRGKGAVGRGGTQMLMGVVLCDHHSEFSSVSKWSLLLLTLCLRVDCSSPVSKWGRWRELKMAKKEILLTRGRGGVGKVKPRPLRRQRGGAGEGSKLILTLWMDRWCSTGDYVEILLFVFSFAVMRAL